MLHVVLGTIPTLRQQKDWVSGSRKWPFLLTFSTTYIYADKLGRWGSKWPKICWRNIGMAPYNDRSFAQIFSCISSIIQETLDVCSVARLRMAVRRLRCFIGLLQ